LSLTDRGGPFQIHQNHANPSRKLGYFVYQIFSRTTVILYIFWQPIPYLLWNFSNETIRIVLYSIFIFGALLVTYSSFLIDHFELFGLKQVFYYFLNKDIPEKPPFKMPGLFKIVRHPLDLGFLIVFWFTPEMSIGHLQLAIFMTCYLFIGTHYEERDLIKKFPSYEEYKQTTPRFIPFLYLFRKHK